jgi:regulator of protease activity HflC (stomatin/prohibitin superfamily)
LKKGEKMDEQSVINKVKYGAIALVLLVVVFGSYTVISPGYSGVLFNRWTGGLSTVGQGMALKMPFLTNVQSYPVALRTYTMVAKSGEGSDKEDDSIDLPTLEGQHIRQDISVTYNTSQERAADVFRAFKGADIEDIEKTFIRRTIITVAQNASGQMSLTELISSKRGELQSAIEKHLGTELDKMGFHLDTVNMGASHLPQAIEAQMQQKMAAQQQAQQAQYGLQKAQVDAQAAVAQAKGEADSQLIKAEAQAKANNLLRISLTAELIRQQAIEKWDGHLPTITGGNSVPVINMKDLTAAASKSQE